MCYLWGCRGSDGVSAFFSLIREEDDCVFITFLSFPLEFYNKYLEGSRVTFLK